MHANHWGSSFSFPIACYRIARRNQILIIHFVSINPWKWRVKIICRFINAFILIHSVPISTSAKSKQRFFSVGVHTWSKLIELIIKLFAKKNVWSGFPISVFLSGLCTNDKIIKAKSLQLTWIMDSSEWVSIKSVWSKSMKKLHRQT